MGQEPQDPGGSSYDVVIVGGGPAGLAVAARLDPGLSVCLLHQDREIGKPVRTSGGSWVRELHRLEIPPTLWNTVTRATISADHARFDLSLRHDPVAILDVTGLYRWLAAQVPHEIRCGAKLLDVTRNGSGFELRYRDADRAYRVLRARRIVDASGWHMAVLSALGLAARPMRRGIGIEHEFAAPDHDPQAAHLFFGRAVPTGYGWAFPGLSGRLRLGIGVIHPETDASPRDLMEDFLRSDQPERLGLTRPAEGHVNSGILPSVAYQPQMIFGDVIRVGDAANMATPILGEGIRHAIEQGRGLGLALSDLVLKGQKTALRDWEHAQKRRFALQYRLGFAANRRAARYGPPDWDRSIARLSRLSPEEITQFLRNEMSAPLILRRALSSLRRRIGL